MYRYIKSSSDVSFASLKELPEGYRKEIIDESGNALELQITEWSNGWDWLLKDSEDIMIADSDGHTFTTPQEALDDFNDWVEFNK